MSRRAEIPSLTRRSLLAGAAGAMAAGGCSRRAVDDPRTLRFWNGFSGPDGATMERLVRRYRDETGVAVKMQIIPWGTYYDKLTLSLAYGGAPDVFVCHAARVAEFARYGKLGAIDDFLRPGVDLDPADLWTNVRAAANVEGRQVGLPLDCHPQGLYYNRRLFGEAGIANAPVTLDAFLDAAARLRRSADNPSEAQWGFAFTYLRTNCITILGQFGASILTPDLRRAALREPAAVTALAFMRDLIERHGLAPKPEGFDSWMGFRQGRVAMAIEGIYMVVSLEEQTGLDYAGAPVPALGPKPAAWAGSHVLCMPAEASEERRQAAWQFMRYLSDNSLDWAAGGQIPVRKSLLDTPRFRAMRVQCQFARELPYVVFEPFSRKATEVMPFFDAAVESALLGLQTPALAFDEAARRIDQVLARP